jgi:hypothetical protein
MSVALWLARIAVEYTPVVDLRKGKAYVALAYGMT